MLGFEKADGKRGMERFVASRLEEGVQAVGSSAFAVDFRCPAWLSLGR